MLKRLIDPGIIYLSSLTALIQCWTKFMRSIGVTFCLNVGLISVRCLLLLIWRMRHRWCTNDRRSSSSSAARFIIPFTRINWEIPYGGWACYIDFWFFRRIYPLRTHGFIIVVPTFKFITCLNKLKWRKEINNKKQHTNVYQLRCRQKVSGQQTIFIRNAIFQSEFQHVFIRPGEMQIWELVSLTFDNDIVKFQCSS